MQKQPFLATPIGGGLVGQITNAIVENLIRAPSVPVSRENSVIVKPEVREAVAKEVGPVIEHLTNNEPAIQSRVTQGAVGAIIIAGGTLLYSWSKGTLSEEVISAQGGIILSACWVLYGRWKARKPLGAG
jgi:hypothetical protein